MPTPREVPMKSIEERVAEIQNCTMPETCSRQPRPGSHVTGCRAEMNEEIVALVRREWAEMQKIINFSEDIHEARRRIQARAEAER